MPLRSAAYSTTRAAASRKAFTSPAGPSAACGASITRRGAGSTKPSAQPPRAIAAGASSTPSPRCSTRSTGRTERHACTLVARGALPRCRSRDRSWVAFRAVQRVAVGVVHLLAGGRELQDEVGGVAEGAVVVEAELADEGAERGALDQVLVLDQPVGGRSGFGLERERLVGGLGSAAGEQRDPARDREAAQHLPGGGLPQQVADLVVEGIHRLLAVAPRGHPVVQPLHRLLAVLDDRDRLEPGLLEVAGFGGLVLLVVVREIDADVALPFADQRHQWTELAHEIHLREDEKR